MIMVLKIKRKNERELQFENFYFGPPDYKRVENLFRSRQICLEPYSKLKAIKTLDVINKRNIFFKEPHGDHNQTTKSIQNLISNVVTLVPRRNSATNRKVSNIEPVSVIHHFYRIECHRTSFTNILSGIYAIFIITLGIVLYIGDIISRKTPLAEFFSIYLVLIGLLYFTFLYLDIRKYKIKLKKQTYNDDVEKYAKELSLWTQSIIGHSYCFKRDTHSGNFYLKVGAAGFCLGHLIHSGLLFAYQILFLLIDSEKFYRCATFTTIIIDILYPVYSFMLLFFIFKYSNIIINKFNILSRFALMHGIGSSVCFWFWTIFRETLESINSNPMDIRNPHTLLHVHHPSHETYNINMTNFYFWYNLTCRGPKEFSGIFQQFSPYLYPFTIEYSILSVSVLFKIWQRIGNHSTECICSSNVLGSNVVLYADCHSSNKGLFAGLLILAGSFLSIILFFVAMAESKFTEIGLFVNRVTELSLILCMTFTTVLAYRQISKLDFTTRPTNTNLDELLLFACIPAFFLQSILSVKPALVGDNYLNLVITLLQTLQVLIQTPFIIDGLKRCSNSKDLQNSKPGRELLMFLVVCNIAMWITETFEIKSRTSVNDPRIKYYGSIIWKSLNHITVPLMMFYRFHSSVCMVDIWKLAYLQGFK